MDIEIQKQIIKDTEDLRYLHNYATYPPYHEGAYIEEYFFNFFMENIDEFSKGERYFLPIWWTDLYIGNKHKDGSIQKYLDSLDKNLKYFAVTQHDNAIQETYDLDLLHYSAGGKFGDKWLPLVCSPIKNPQSQPRDIFASFIGTLSHKRQVMFQPLTSQPNKYVIGGRGFWRAEIPKSEEQQFMDVMGRSIFALCPRGFGATSFRMYEAMQFGTIPIYISDKHCLPWDDELDWSEFCVIVTPQQVNQLDTILGRFTQEEIQTMSNKVKELYPKYFSLEGMCNNILKRI